MPEYALRPVEATDPELVRTAALLHGVFPGSAHFTTAVLEWQYRLSPNGPAVGFNAWNGAELAGHYVTIPMLAVVDGSVEKGLLSLNTATAPAHQGKGLFTKLANATYDKAAAAGYSFVAGVANANSTPAFVRKLGFQLVSPLRAMFGIGPLPKRSLDVAAGFAPQWDDATIAWRLRHPAYPYTWLHEQGRDLVLSKRSQYGARYVLGELPSPVAPGLLPMESGNVRVKAWIGLEPGMRWTGSAYVNIPMRFRPAPLNLIFKDLTGKGRVLDAGAVRWSAMDFDVL